MKRKKITKTAGWITYLVGSSAVVILLNVIVSVKTLPDYGKWTGVRPLEHKLRLLKKFADQGPVDALILGSSIADYGFSAEEFSKLMSAHLGRPFRAFNFSTGAAEISFFPTLYRLARSVSQPQMIIAVTPPQHKRGDEIRESTPDFFIQKSAAHSVLQSPLLLKISRWTWEIPMIRFAPAIRDFLLNGKFTHFQTEGADLYHVNEHGDRISLTYALTRARREVEKMRPVFEDQLVPSKSTPQLSDFFPKIDIDAMKELIELVRRDNVKLELLAHAPASVLMNYPSKNAAYREGRRQYLATFAKKFEVPYLSILDTFAAQPFEIADNVHVNYYGAVHFTQRVFEEMTHKTLPPSKTFDDWEKSPILAPQLDQISSDDPSFNVLSAVILRNKSTSGGTLRVYLVKNRFAIAPLPAEKLWIGLRTSEQRDQFAEVQRVSDQVIQARFDSLPHGKPQVYIARLFRETPEKKDPLYLPFASYEWVEP